MLVEHIYDVIWCHNLIIYFLIKKKTHRLKNRLLNDNLPVSVNDLELRVAKERSLYYDVLPLCISNF